MDEFVTTLNAAGGAFVAFAAHMLIQSGVLIVVLAALDVVLRSRVRAVVRYWIWLLVLAKLLLPPSLSSPTGLAYWIGAKLPTPAAQVDRLAQETPAPTPANGEAIASSSPHAWDFGPMLGHVAQEPAMARADSPLPASPSAAPGPTLTWQALALLVWAVTVLVMAVLLIQRALFVRGLVAQSCEPPEEVAELLCQCGRRLGVRTKLAVRLSPLSASPSVCGLWRPVILIPQAMLAQLHGPELRSILFHELAHIKRGDLWLNLVQTLLQIAYFYHPLLWAANARIRRVREQAVDETVLAAMGEEAEEYPRTLLSVSRLAFGQSGLSLRLLGVVESKNALMDRIRHIASRPFPKTAKLGFAGFILVLVAGAALLPMARARAFVESPAGNPAVISGRIMKGGSPVGGAKVTLHEALVGKPPFETRVLAETTSAEDGTYRLSVAAGDTPGREGPPYGTIVVQKEGLSIGWASWRDMRWNEQRDIALTEPKDLAGTVVDGQGQPVAGATVFAVGGRYEKRPVQVGYPEYLYTGVARRLLTATTDAVGKFTVRGLPAAARFELAATKAGYGPGYTWKPEVRPEEGLLLVPGRTDLRMVMPPEARIEGKVVEKGSGKPVAGVEIAALCWRTSRLLWPVPVRSDDAGAFVMEGLLADEYILRLAERREQPADWATPPVTQEVKAGEVKRDVRIEVSKGGLVEIAVTDACEPKPVPGALVRVQRPSNVYEGVTKADGVAQIRLTPGTYAFTDLFKEGYTYGEQERKETFTVEEGRTLRLSWPVRPLPVVSGVVRDEAGRPVPGADVRVQPMGGEAVLSDAQGRFRVTWNTRNWSGKTRNYLVALDRQHRLASVQTTVKDHSEVELTLRPTATFVGRVIDINDRGIPEAEVQIMLWGPTWGSRLFRSDTLTTDRQGRFEIPTIPPGHKYHITIVADGYGRTDTELEPYDVVVGRVEVGTLHLARANLAVSGIVVDSQGKPVPDASISTVAGPSTGQRDLRTRTDAEGRFRLEGLCAGPVHLQAAARIEGASLFTNVETQADMADLRIVLTRKD